MSTIGSIKAFFGLDPSPAVKGMKTATAAVNSGTKKINTSLKSVKRMAVGAFTGWGIGELAKDFAQAAMDMDSMKKSMAAAVGGMEKGRREINYLRAESKRMGLDFKSSAKDFKQLAAAAKGTALEGAGIRKVWKSLQNATVALQLTTAETSGTVYAFKDMLSKGTVQAEELKRQLGNRLPGAFRLAADAMGMTTQELSKQMKMGKLMADDFLPALARALDKTYAGAAVESSKTMRAELNRMKSAWFDFQATFSDASGLSEAISETLRAISSTLSKSGDPLSEWAAKMAHDLNIGIIWPLDLIMTNFIKASEYAKKFGENVKFSIKYLSLDSAYVKMKYGAQILWWELQNIFRKGMIATIKGVESTMETNGGPLFKALAKSLAPSKNKLLESFKKDTQETNKEIEDLKAERDLALEGLSPMDITDLEMSYKKIEEETAIKMEEHSSTVAGMYEDNAKKMQEKIKKIKGKKEAPLDLGDFTPEKEELTKWQVIFQSLEDSFDKLSAKSMDVAKNIQSVFESAFKGIEDAIAQMVTKGKVDWSSLADSMIADMARIATRQAITGPLMAALGQWMGSLGATSISASPMSVSPVSTPSSAGLAPIKMAKGGMINEHIIGTGQSTGRQYEMGESGAEAVLNKDQIKNLASNKGTVVSVQPQINISTPPGTQATTQTSSDGMNMDVLITMIENKLSSNMRRGSGLSDTMQQTFGLNRSSGAFR